MLLILPYIHNTYSFIFCNFVVAILPYHKNYSIMIKTSNRGSSDLSLLMSVRRIRILQLALLEYLNNDGSRDYALFSKLTRPLISFILISSNI